MGHFTHVGANAPPFMRPEWQACRAQANSSLEPTKRGNKPSPAAVSVVKP